MLEDDEGLDAFETILVLSGNIYGQTQLDKSVAVKRSTKNAVSGHDKTSLRTKRR